MNNLKFLREYIREILKHNVSSKQNDEASTAASISGYTLPLGMSNNPKDMTDEEIWKSYAKSFGNAKKI